MTTPLYILLLAAPIGGIDVIYYHIWRFRLFQSRQSVAEQITHTLRGLVFMLALIAFTWFQPHGAWIYAITGLFIVDILNGICDVAVEPASRRPQGVPPGEAVIHFLGASALGAAFLAFLYEGWHLRAEPTALLRLPPDALPSLVQLWSLSVLVSSLALWILELSLFVRARLLQSRLEPTQSA